MHVHSHRGTPEIVAAGIHDLKAVHPLPEILRLAVPIKEVQAAVVPPIADQQGPLQEAVEWYQEVLQEVVHQVAPILPLQEAAIQVAADLLSPVAEVVAVAVVVAAVDADTN